MKYTKPKTAFLIFLMYGFSGIQAQTSILATGGEATGSGGSSSYSVGQVFYATRSGTNISLSEGIQQAYEISVLNGIGQNTKNSFKCSVYPNPTSEFLLLNIENVTITGFDYKLFDVNGKLLKNANIQSNETSIDIKNLKPALYYLKITDHKKRIKTFKIVKH